VAWSGFIVVTPEYLLSESPVFRNSRNRNAKKDCGVTQSSTIAVLPEIAS
jgi:hypothetical protein